MAASAGGHRMRSHQGGYGSFQRGMQGLLSASVILVATSMVAASCSSSSSTPGSGRQQVEVETSSGVVVARLSESDPEVGRHAIIAEQAEALTEVFELTADEDAAGPFIIEVGFDPSRLAADEVAFLAYFDEGARDWVPV